LTKKTSAFTNIYNRDVQRKDTCKQIQKISVISTILNSIHYALSFLWNCD